MKNKLLFLTKFSCQAPHQAWASANAVVL